jgi:hypothetical protein
MVTTAIALQRLYQQRLTQNQFSTPEEIVAWMGAVQGQDYLGTKWALGMRLQNGNDETIEQAFNEGRILRTHVMRPTWHFVTPTDIRWLVELTAPRVNALSASYFRQLELDDALFARSNEVIVKALEGGRHLTRAELGAALSAVGIAADGIRLGYIIFRAELDALVCSGPRRGKQFTYALLDERAPQAKSLPREEALAELTRRYFTSHGPATVHDFAWWSGLTVADTKAGLGMVGAELTHEVIDEQTYYFSASMPPVSQASNDAFLLPSFDEFTVGFASFDETRRGQEAPENVAFYSPIVMRGRVIGSWRRTLKAKAAYIDIAPFAPLKPTENEAIQAAAQRYGQFVGLPVTSNVM